MSIRFNITYLQFHRDFLKLTLWTLKRLPKEYREQICLHVCTRESSEKSPGWIERYRAFVDAYVDGDFEWTVQGFPYGINYIKKVRWACQQDVEYSFKWDEDVFINEYVIRYMMDNAEELQRPENLLIAPALSNGIPTTDMFTAEYFTPGELSHLHDIYLKTDIPSMWGAGFEKLNDHTLGATRWDATAFYAEVDKVKHYYRGIHPVRINYDAAEYICDRVLEKVEEYKKARKYELVTTPAPYFCNSLFLIRTKEWADIAFNEGLFRDSFDEVPLNVYKIMHDKQMLFIRNAFGVHPIYQALKDKRTDSLEKRFFEEFQRKVTGLVFDIA